ncbi:MAG: hypothetical protein MUO97_04480 [Dehalococcoidia bacterium]|nr:hypothetical protein [Dehalococcoidia bacterium]
MKLFKDVPPCHCEPFALCHSERSEESHTARGKLRLTIPFVITEEEERLFDEGLTRYQARKAKSAK